MNQEGNRMKHGKAILLALVAAVVTACASGGAGAAPGEQPMETGNRPQETEATRAAGVHLVQAGLAEGEEARAAYQEALTDALAAVSQTPENPKAYLVAGQAAVGLGEWVQADTMFDRALDLYPGYADQMVAEREQAWVTAYNLGAEAVNTDPERAIMMFEGADRLYQGRAEARIALGSLYSNQGDAAAAAEAYLGAAEILSAQGPPEGLNEEELAQWNQSRQDVTLNAAQLLAQAGDFDRAASTLQGYLDEYGAELDAATSRRLQTALAGFYAQAGDAERAEAMYSEIMGRADLTADEYFQAAIGFFNTGDYGRAAEAFAAAAEMNPHNRDAHLNLVQALYSQAAEMDQSEESGTDADARAVYEQLIEAGQVVRQMDPLNRNLITFMLRGYRSLADLTNEARSQELNRQTQQLFREYQSQPYGVSDIQLTMRSQSEAQVSGTLTNFGGTAGETVRLQFEVVGSQGQVIDSTVIEVAAPAQGSAAQFSETVNIPGGEFAGWRYERLQ